MNKPLFLLLLLGSALLIFGLTGAVNEHWDAVVAKLGRIPLWGWMIIAGFAVLCSGVFVEQRGVVTKRDNKSDTTY